MNSQRPAKVCLVCEEDCSGKPRTKDAQGNYYCTPCYERRVEEFRQAHAARKTPPKYEPPTPQPASDLFAIDPNLIAQEAASVGPSQGATCPSCGMAVQANAVICMNCGLNMQTGHSLHVVVKKDRSGSSDAVAGLLLSPMAVGLAALLVFGVFCLIGMQDTAAAAAFMLAVAGFGLVLGIWAIVVGFMEGIGYGLATLCVPFFVLYTVYGLNENSYLKWLYSVHLLCLVPYMYFSFQLDALLNQPGFAF